VLVVSSILFPLATRNLSKDNPGRFQQMLELLVGGLKGLLDDIVGHGGQRFLNIIGAFAVFIFISNIFGLLYFLQPPTANTNTTFALSITAFLYYNFQGIKAQGVVHYIKHFMGPIPWLAPLMFPIELIGHFARILSLGMRLFGNILGEHTATGIFVGMFPLLLPWPMMGLGIFGSFLQTFVFIMLTMVYLGGAVAAEEH
jgi:F-type H+-transporting ATPase subunit a